MYNKLKNIVDRYTLCDVLRKNINASVSWITQTPQSSLSKVDNLIQSKFRNEFFAVSVDENKVYHVTHMTTENRHIVMRTLDCYLEISNYYKNYQIVQIELVLHPSLSNLIDNDSKKRVLCDTRKVNIWELARIDGAKQPELIPLIILNCHPTEPILLYREVFNFSKQLEVSQGREARRICRDIWLNTETMLSHL